ncbi:MAG: primosomal protein N' [Salinivirgaceae bacterium]
MNQQLTFIDVILPLPLKSFFTYQVPDSFVPLVKQGVRVIVPFGTKKLYTALVFSVHHKKPIDYQTKIILDVLDANPIINPFQLRLWEWTADYYMCSLGEVYKAALPSGLRLESETRLLTSLDEVPESANEKEQLIFRIVQKQTLLSVTELAKICQLENPLPLLKKMMEKGWLSIQEDLKKTYKPKMVKYLSLAKRIDTIEKIEKCRAILDRAPKQQELFNFLIKKLKNDPFSGQEFIKAELLDEAGTTAATLKSLVEKNIIKETEQETSRLIWKNDETKPVKTLNQQQLKAMKGIQDAFAEKPVVLLHGVTSSGKTEIYIHLIQNAIDMGKQVLYLLPEIALTSQIIQRLSHVFGNKVGVYHSKFSDAERVEIYQKVAENSDSQLQIILGARSAIFLPFSNLGLIVVDEEHENTYKQFDPAPRYNARDLAVVSGLIHKAPVLLGTATPSIESYYNAQTGRYGLVELMERHQNIKMPKILVADVRKAHKKKEMHAHFTPMLIQNIDEALENKEQVILFQNRRGFSPYLECASCGWIPKCKWCDVSLTYHKGINKLTCHYCGYSIDNVYRCGHCKQPDLETKGFGTEKVEDEIQLIYPEARVARLDLDTTRGKYGHETIINNFQNQHIDILIGTQMVSKGLDFDHVSVVGILNADNMLKFPDFRAYERSYQLMAQVSGRAGRKNKQGKVIIQTNDTEHAIIQQVIQNNYVAMFNQQLSERRNFNYPPFSRLIKLTLKHRDQHVVTKAAQFLVNAIKAMKHLSILGPTVPAIPRIQNQYLRTALIKLDKGNQVTQVKRQLTVLIEDMKNQPQFKSVIIIPDVDPQ